MIDTMIQPRYPKSCMLTVLIIIWLISLVYGKQDTMGQDQSPIVQVQKQKSESPVVSSLEGWKALRITLQKRTDRERDGFRGLVQSAVEKTSLDKNEDRHYDLRGNLTEKNDYLFGKLSWGEVRNYDPLGKLIEEFHYKEGVLQYRLVHTYDALGNLLETRSHDGREFYRNETYIYDPIHNEVEIRTSGDKVETRKSVYKVARDKIEKADYTPSGLLRERHVYDHDGNIVEKHCGRGFSLKLA